MPTTRKWEIQSSMCGPPVDCFFPRLLRVRNLVRVIEGKLYRNGLRGNKNYFDLAGGKSYREFHLLRVKLQ